jgi:hypothetical protein
MDGTPIAWAYYGAEPASNTLIWCVLVAAPLLLRLASRHIWTLAAWAVPALIVTSCGVGLATTYDETTGSLSGATDYRITTFDGLFTASTSANQYVFVLDSMDPRYVQEIQAEDPEFFSSQFGGFTEFDNHISNYNRTLPSATVMMTGQHWQFDSPRERWSARAYHDGTFLPALRDAGYSTNLYATELYSYYAISDIEDVADNIGVNEVAVDEASVVKVMSRLVAFRYAPHVAKPTFRSLTDPVAGLVEYTGQEDAFTGKNLEFRDRLERDGLQAAGEQPRFSYIHLDGAHLPVVMDADMQQVPVDSLEPVEQAKGAFRMVFAYLDELTRLGLYDTASVVITADHGEQSNSAPMEQPVLTALFVKPAGASRDQPLEHSDAPTQFANVRAALLADAGIEDPDGVPTVWQVPVDSREPREYHFWRYSEGVVEHYEVIGDARDWSNWRHTGTTPADFF